MLAHVSRCFASRRFCSHLRCSQTGLLRLLFALRAKKRQKQPSCWRCYENNKREHEILIYGNRRGADALRASAENRFAIFMLDGLKTSRGSMVEQNQLTAGTVGARVTVFGLKMAQVSRSKTCWFGKNQEGKWLLTLLGGYRHQVGV